MSVTKQLADALSFANHVMRQGMHVRMDDRWPALKEPLESAIKRADEVLAAYEAEDEKRMAESAIKYLICDGWNWDGEHWKKSDVNPL